MYDFKKDFPLFKDRDIIYLDNAATAQKPACVIEAEKEFYEKHNANPLRGFYPLSLEATDAYEAARKTVQHFIHAASETEIIFTRNTTESLNLVAYSYGLNNLCPEDEIVVSIMEHHSNLLVWQQAAKLPEIEIRKPQYILAKDTVTSMQGGLVYGYIGQTEYIIRKMKEESGLGKINVVATGGLGKMIAQETSFINYYDANLTLKGLQIIYDKQKQG